MGSRNNSGMKLEGMTLKKFIEGFDANFEDFILRVRDPKKEYNTGDNNKSLVYYNGIESFTVKDNGESIELDFPINVYKLNPTGFKNVAKDNNEEEVLADVLVEDLEEGESLAQKEKNYRKEVGDILDAMHRLFDFEMSKIKFDINFEEKDPEKNKEKKKVKTKNQIVNEFYKLIKEFTKYTASHNRAKNRDLDKLYEITNDKNDDIIYSNATKEEVKNICDELSGKVSFILTFIPPLTTKKEEMNSTPKDIITLQCWFLRKARDIGTASGLEFTVCSNYINKNYKPEIALSKFSKNTKKAIDKYKKTSCRKLEKTYQHYFMLRAKEMKDLFAVKEGEFIDYFEQEYGIYNPNVFGAEKFMSDQKKDKTGRIDCIVYKYRKNGNTRVISDIYMIELKVNCDVVLGNNGVMTHLEDIKAFLNLNTTDKWRYYDYLTLEKRISDRIKIISGEEVNLDKVAKHFYTVIGYTNKDEKDSVMQMLNSLTTDEGIKEMILTGVSKKVKGETKRYKLDPRFEGTTLLALKEDIKDCEIKFFLESIKKEDFTKEDIGLEFKDITEEIFSDN